jgi:hypothetical protein
MLRRYLEGCTLTAFERGSRYLVLRIRARTGYRPTWRHLGGAVAGVYFLWPVVGPVAPTITTVTACVWVVAAMAIGASGAGPETPAADRADQATGSGEGMAGGQAPPADETLYALIRYVAAQSDQGTAAHLPDLLAEGQRRGLLTGWEQADLRAHLAALGAPLVEGKKLTFGGRQRNRQAVLLAGLPEADPAPVPALTKKVTEEAAQGPSPALSAAPPTGGR